MPPCFSLRDWYERGKSCPTGRKFSTIYLPTPVSPFHAEPLHMATVSITFVNRPSSEMIAKLKAGGYRYEAGNWFKSQTQGKHADEAVVSQLVAAS
jgi:hypothetical protein